MKRIFAAGEVILNRMKFPQKFGLIGVILFLPIIFFSFTLVTQQNAEANLLVQRYQGLTNAGLLKDFMRDVQQHRAMTSSFLGGDQSYAEQMKNKQAEIQEDMQKIDRFYQETAPDLATKAAWEQLKSAWPLVINGVENQQAVVAIKEHTDYIAKIEKHMIDVADATELVLAKKPETFYIIQSVVKTLPELTEKLGQTRANGLAVLSAKLATDQQSRTIANLHASIQSVAQALDHEMTIAKSSSPAMADAYDTAKKQMDLFLALVDKEVIQTSTYTLDPQEYFTFSTETIDIVFKLYEEEHKFIMEEIETQIGQSLLTRNLTLAITVVALLLAVYGFISFYSAMMNSIRKFQDAAELVTQGDLTAQIVLNTRDEMVSISNSFNTTISTLRNLVLQVGKNAEQLAASSEELNASAEQTSKATEQITEIVQEVALGTEQQVQSMTDSNKSLQEMSRGVQEIARSAQSVSQSAMRASEVSKDGNAAIKEAVGQMQGIHATITDLSSIVKGLGIRSQEIGQILEAITSIAAQTNLLALNAAIEAARAGEHGRGFAVVADEVRKLAEESSLSARKIAELIQAIQEETNKAVQSMDAGTREVTEGIKVVDQAGQAFALINQSVGQVAGQIQEVSASAEELSAGTDQVVSASATNMKITEEIAAGALTISSGTEEQLASMEEISASSLALSRMAEELQETINRFKV